MTQTPTPDRLDRIEANIEVLSERVGQLAQSIGELREVVSHLAGGFAISERRMEQFERQAIADREAFQAESRRIWEYLLSQHPNGSS